MPVLELKHPVTGQVKQVKWEDGQAAPSPEDFSSLFDEPTPDPNFSVAPQTPPLIARPPKPTISRGLPNLAVPEDQAVTSTAPRPSDEDIANFLKESRSNPEAMKEFYKQSAGIPVPPTIDPDLEAERQAVSQVPDALLSPLAGAENAMKNIPTALQGGAEKIGKGAMQLLAPYYPALSASSGVDEQGNPTIQPKPLTGLLNIGAGLAEGVGGAAMGLTPVGWGISAAQQVAGLDPDIQKFTQGLMAPAEKFQLAQKLGLNPENARNLNDIGDTIWQVLAMRKLGAFEGSEGLPDRSTLDNSPVEPSLVDRFKTMVKSGDPEYWAKKALTGDQPVQPLNGPDFSEAGQGQLASSVIPADPFDMMKKVKDLKKMIPYLQDPNDPKEVGKLFDTTIRDDGPVEGLGRQYTIDDPTTPAHKATFYVDPNRGQTLADRVIEKNEVFASGAYEKLLKTAPEPTAPPPTMPARAEDYYAAQALEAGKTVNPPEVHQQFHDAIMQYGMDQLDKTPSFTGAVEPTALRSDITPGLSIDKLNETIKRMMAGNHEIPFYYDDQADNTRVGLAGQSHGEAFGKKGSTAKIAGRINTDGTLVAIWGDKGDMDQQKLTNGLFSLLQQGRVKQNARVYWPDGTNMSIRDAISGEGQKLFVSAVPGVSAPMIEKTVKLAKNLLYNTGGFTVNPRTGEKADFEPDSYAVSQFGERQKIFDRTPTQEDIDGFIRDNGDLLKMADHHLGGWYNKENGKTYLDVVNVLPREEAVALGKRENQVAVGRTSKEGKYQEIATGGTGEFPEGYQHPVPAGDRLAKFREENATPEEKATLEAQRQRRINEPAFAQEYGEQSNQIETGKRIIEHQKSLGYEPVPTEDYKGAVKRLVETTDPQIKTFLDAWQKHTEATGEARPIWYEGMKQAQPILAKHYPELADKENYDLFTHITSIYGNGADPATEMLNGIAAWERYQKEGEIRGGRVGDEYYGSVRDKLIGNQLKSLNNLVRGEGVEGANAWLRGDHSGADIIAMRNKIGLADRDAATGISPKETYKGAMIFGPKLGPYDLNKLGVHDLVTNDKWMGIWGQLSRGILRIRRVYDNPQQPMGEEALTDANGRRYQEQLGAATPKEMQIQTDAVKELAAHYKLSPDDMQAVIWNHVVRPAFEKAGQTMKGAIGNHGDFAKRWNETGWFDRRLAGEEGGRIEDAGKIARERGLSEAATSGPESLRPKGEAAEPEGGDLSFDFGLKPSDQRIIDKMGPEGSARMSIVPGLPDPTLEGEGKAKDLVGKYAGSINVNQMNVDEDAKKRLHAYYQAMKPQLEQLLGKTLSDEEVRDAAENSPPLDQVMPFSMQKNVAAGVLKLRQVIAEGSMRGDVTKEYYENYVRLQSIAKFAGRLLQKFNVKADPNAFNAMGGESAKLPAANQLQMDVLQKIAATGARMDDVIDQAHGLDWKNPREVAKFYRQYVKPTAWELLTEFRYINMLSSPLTHIIKSASEAQAFTLATATRAGAGVVGTMQRAVGLKGEHYMGEAPRFVGGAMQAFPGAIKAAADVMAGRTAMDRYSVDRLPSMGQAANKAMIPIAKFNQAFGSVTHALEAASQFWIHMAEGGEIKARTYQAKKLGQDPVAQMAQIAVDAHEAARRWMFRSRPNSSGENGQGSVLNTIDAVTEQINKLRSLKGNSAQKSVRDVANFFIPFVNTPMNILKAGIEYSPMGFTTMIRAGDKTTQFSKAMIGSTVFAGAAALVANTQSTWDTPNNASDRADFQAAGKVPYAIKIGDRWFQYNKMGALAYPIALAAAWKEYSTDPRYENLGGRVGAAMAGYAKFFGDQSYVQGLTDLTKNLEGNVKSFAQDTPANFARQLVPLDALQGWVNTIFDPKIRVATSPFERLESGIPGLSQNLTERSTPLGEPATRVAPAQNLFNLTPIKTSVESTDPVVRAVGRLGLKIGVPSRVVFGQTLENDQYQRYVKEVGQDVKQEITSTVLDPSFAKIPKSEQQETIDMIVHNVRRGVKMEMFQDLYERQAEQQNEQPQETE